MIWAFYSSAITATLSEIESLESGGELVAAVRARYQQLRKKVAEIQQYIENDIAMALRSARPLTTDAAERLAGLVQTMKNIKDMAANAMALLEKSQLFLTNATRDYKNASKAFEVC